MKKLLGILVLGLLLSVNVGYAENISIEESLEKAKEEEHGFILVQRCGALFQYIFQNELTSLTESKSNDEKEKILKEFKKKNIYFVSFSIFYVSGIGFYMQDLDYDAEKASKIMSTQINEWISIYQKIAKKNLNNSGDFLIGGYIKKDLVYCKDAAKYLIEFTANDEKARKFYKELTGEDIDASIIQDNF